MADQEATFYRLCPVVPDELWAGSWQDYPSEMSVRARVTCCFAAANVAEVATRRRRALIVTDNDKPIPQFNGLGTGEYFARRAGLAWAMPPTLGTDANDLHLSAGLPALQTLLLDLMQRRSCAA